MSRADLEHLMLKKPQVGIRITHLLSERLHSYEERMEDLTLKDIHARLANLILLLCEGEGVMTPQDIRIPHHYTHERLGTMIGAKREAVTRAFAKLQDEGGVVPFQVAFAGFAETTPWFLFGALLFGSMATIFPPAMAISR